MKITELKCSSCHGTLKVDEKNPNIAICEYCQTKHVLEHEGRNEVHLGTQSQIGPKNMVEKPSRLAGNKVRSILAVIGALFVVFMIPILGEIGKTSTSYSAMNGKIQTNGIDSKNVLSKDKTEKQITLTGALAEMVEEATGKSVELIMEEDLSRFSCIKIKSSLDYIWIGYSFDNPYVTDEAALAWIEFPRDDTNVKIKQLSLFKELKYLEVPYYLSQNELNELKLEGISCYANTPAELAACFDNAEELKEVNIQSGLQSLEGLEQLKGIERLTVYGSSLKDITNIAGLKKLKALTLESCDGVTDTSVLHVMTGLEELSIESETLKDISFVKKMPGLKSLALYNTKILNLDSLEGNENLSSLVIEDCDELQNCDAISGLTGLKHLYLEVSYNSADPNLGELTQLESLTISGMDTVGFLQNMSNLISLEIEGCKINENSAFSALENLKTLKCRHIYSYDSDWGFVAKIPSLEVLDLSSLATYEDISALFNMPTLKKLYLNGMECELNFSALQPNESLEVLEMDGMKLYKNVDISGGGGIIYVDYDSVTLDEHTDFLTNYPNLKELSLAENKLTNILFAEHLNNLEMIDIDENYVTDLKPLASLSRLRKVWCRGNPVENYRVLNEELVIVK